MDKLIVNINNISLYWWEFMVQNSLQIMVLFLIALLMNVVFKRKSPLFLYGIWFVAFLKTLVPARISLDTLNISLLPITQEILGTEFNLNTLVVFSSKSSNIDPSLSFPSYLFLFWMIVVIWLIFRMISREFNVRKLLNNSSLVTPLPLSIRMKEKLNVSSNIGIYTSDLISASFTKGLFRPNIYLPAQALNWDERERCAVLSHELAHIERRDFLMIVLQQIVKIIYFFHPALGSIPGKDL